jgi:galactose-1-phosphate uridylyltransferase
MTIEYGSRDGALIWMRNPFTGFISYVVDHDKRMAFELDECDLSALSTPDSQKEQMQEAMAGCPFCPGNESKVLSELLRVTPDEVPGWDGDPASPWTIRVFNNLYPRFPPEFTGGRNESYVVVEDPRHFLPVASPPGNLMHSGALSEAHHNRLLEVNAAVVERSFGNSAVKSVVVRKNQGRGSGASQPHIHQQVVGSPVCFPAVEAELRALVSSPQLWDELIALLYDLSLVIDSNSRVVSYASPIAAFQQSYDVVMPTYRGMLNQLDREGLGLFGRAIHHILRFLGPLPFEYEIHQAERLPPRSHQCT